MRRQTIGPSRPIDSGLPLPVHAAAACRPFERLLWGPALAGSVPSPFSDQTSTLTLLDGQRADAAGGVVPLVCVCATVDRQGGSRTVPGLVPALFFFFAFSREGCSPEIASYLRFFCAEKELNCAHGAEEGEDDTTRRHDTTAAGVENVSASLVATDRLSELATGGLIAKKTRTTRAGGCGRGAADTYHAGGETSGPEVRGRSGRSSPIVGRRPVNQSRGPWPGGGPPARHHWTPKQQQARSGKRGEGWMAGRVQ